MKCITKTLISISILLMTNISSSIMAKAMDDAYIQTNLTNTQSKNMADYKQLVPIILKYEGGYAANIDGKTCTMKGITLATFRQYLGKQKTCKELRGISNAEWEYIFKEGYWDRWRADSINNQSIANLLVDWTFNSGIYGIKYPQRVLGVKDDGIVGEKTLSAINNHPNQEELFNKLWNRRKKHYEDIVKSNPSKKKFINGWLKRLSAFKYSK